MLGWICQAVQRRDWAGSLLGHAPSQINKSDFEESFSHWFIVVQTHLHLSEVTLLKIKTKTDA